MATGLNIRDFVKAYRELRYDGSGSIRLSEVEHNAYLQRLTVEITHFDASRAQNFKTLPENTHWGYLTAFKGTSVISNTPVKFAKQRVFELINQGIWNYQDALESASVITGAIQTYGNLALGELSSLGDGIGIVGILINAVEGVENLTAPAFAWLYEQVTGEESPEDVPTKAYTPYPIASPFPDVFKFKTDIPASFLLRLESWYLVNPAVYITSNPTDTSDETDGESEYPMPDPGDGDGDGSSFPAESPRDPNNDSRDYTDGTFGEQGTWIVILNYSNAGNNPACNDVPNQQVNIAGLANSPPILITTAPPNSTGAPAKSLQTQLQTIAVARDCAVAIEGTPTFLPGQVVFP